MTAEDKRGQSVDPQSKGVAWTRGARSGVTMQRLARQRLAMRGTATAMLGSAKRGQGEERHSDEMMRKGIAKQSDAKAKHSMALIRKGTAEHCDTTRRKGIATLGVATARQGKVKQRQRQGEEKQRQTPNDNALNGNRK